MVAWNKGKKSWAEESRIFDAFEFGWSLSNGYLNWRCLLDRDFFLTCANFHPNSIHYALHCVLDKRSFRTRMHRRVLIEKYELSCLAILARILKLPM